MTEEVLRNIEYIRCPDCYGARAFPSLIPGFLSWNCLRCRGWGCVVDPPSLEERIELGLRAIHSSVIIELTTDRKRRPSAPPRKKRK